MKLNTLLAIEKNSQNTYAKAIAGNTTNFAKKQGSFKGWNKTSVPREGYFVDPSKVSTVRVAFTVDEELAWFEQTIVPYLKMLFSKEATNSMGANTVELVVNGVKLGRATALELMRLNSLLSSPELNAMYNSIPTRESDKIWQSCQNDESYTKRGVVCTPLVVDVSKTLEKEEYILKDPNIDPAHIPGNYQGKTAVRTKSVITSDDTRQFFSGEWTLEKRAELLKRLSDLKQAVAKALQEVNDIEAVQSNLKIDALVQYIHGDIIR